MCEIVGHVANFSYVLTRQKGYPYFDSKSVLATRSMFIGVVVFG